MVKNIDVDKAAKEVLAALAHYDVPLQWWDDVFEKVKQHASDISAQVVFDKHYGVGTKINEWDQDNQPNSAYK